MKIERKENEVVAKRQVSNQGAYVGDQIMFSSHNPANKDMGIDITANKLYTVLEIRHGGWAVFKDDVNSLNCAYDNNYDVIVRAPYEQPKLQFQPVTITLETQGEIDLMASLLGASIQSQRDSFTGQPDSYNVFDKLDDMADCTRPRFKIELK